MKTLEHLKETATRSFYWTSFSPEKRGESVVNDYSAELDADILRITSQGANAEQVARYKSNYEGKLRGWLHSHSNVASTMITGGSNFPAERNRKRSQWANNHYSNFREWREKVLNTYDKYERKMKIEAAGGELQIMKNNVTKCEALAVQMVAANKVIRKAIKDKLTVSDCILKLAEIGMPEDEARQILKPSFSGGVGYATYQMANNNANIKRMKQRVIELEAKEQRADKDAKEFPFTGGKVVFNYELDRLQIYNDQKPEYSVISEYRHNGFKWSPSNKCWQRQLTQNALSATERLLKVTFS